MAVEAFQKREGLALSGLADRATLIALGPRVYISLAHFSLVLDEPGVPLRRFPIAHGTDQYPTPTGSFTVIEKVPDPTWLPPDSPWAEGVEPVPPGPGNPLGTRWIGLTGGMVGIHGTSSPGSIGSRASHGCVRMYVSDVERLYEMVKVGTPVTIFGGWESSKELQKYWN
ncbi:MAG: L,D-transpeptidase family protein [Armatimonadetes bacterium]|nr:L,D-transpeptidase family protein [Armatimonadota bacterium]